MRPPASPLQFKYWVKLLIFWKFKLAEQTQGFQKSFRWISLCINFVEYFYSRNPDWEQKISKLTFRF